MTTSNTRNHWITLVVPFIFLSWSFIRSHLAGPFFLSHIDPEYPYLLNGLNCAIFKFDLIGHVDHPGTPFQLLTGIFIWITYLFAGHGSLVNDVIANPEFYLAWSTFYITLITTFILAWIGKTALRAEQNYMGVSILQASVFFYINLIGLSARYYPERLLVICVLILVGLCIKYLYEKDFSEKRFAEWNLIRLSTRIKKQPPDSLLTIYYQYKGHKKTYIDDFSFYHVSSQDAY